jgi:hypothetical protein
VAVSTEPSIFFSKKELNQISRVFRNMDDIAKEQAKTKIQELVGKQLSSIRAIARSRGKVAQRVADGGQIKKSSLQGELKFGFASQRFSGGATTQFNTRNDAKGNRKGIGAGAEFGSSNYPQFPRWSVDQCLKGRVQEVGLFIQLLEHLNQKLLKNLMK